jgi:hypothetical protein
MTMAIGGIEKRAKTIGNLTKKTKIDSFMQELVVVPTKQEQGTKHHH